MLPKVDRGKIEEHKQEFQAAIPMIEYYREIGEEGYLKHFKEKIRYAWSIVDDWKEWLILRNTIMLQIDKLYQKITNDSLIPDVEDFQKNNGVIDYQTFKYFYDMPVKSQGASRKKEL